MCKWRRGWRSDVLRIRKGLIIEQPEQPVSKQDENGTICGSCEDQERFDNIWSWWQNEMGAPKLVLAPMIGQSDLAFRLLCQENGVTLCYTQMYLDEAISAGEYDRELQAAGRSDLDLEPLSGIGKRGRPLICQLAGNRPEAMAAAAKHLEVLGVVDAIDVNYGCPQRCAKEGNYGSFLLQNDPDLAVRVVEAMVAAVKLPVVVKLRLHLDGLAATIATALRFQNVGVSALCLHGRTNTHTEHEGPADWVALRAVKQALHIPLIANGSVQSCEDAVACLRYTGVDAVMSGTGLLRTPSLFANFAEQFEEQSNKSVVTDASASGVDVDGEPVPKRARLADGIALGQAGLPAILRDARRYLKLSSKCYATELISVGPVPGKHTELAGRYHPAPCKVIRDHLLAMFQGYLMDIHMDLWSLLGCEEVRSVIQFQEICNCIEHRLSVDRSTEITVFTLHQIKFSKFD